MEPGIAEVLYYIFLGLLTSIGQLLVLIFCIYYLVKMGVKTDSILLILGSVLSLLCIIAVQIGVLYSKSWGMDKYLIFTYVLQGFSFLSSLLFAIGFFLLIRRVIKNKQ